MTAKEKAKKTLEMVLGIFEKNTRLRDQFRAFLDNNKSEDAHEVARKLVHTYEILRKHERLLLNLEKREGLTELEQAQKNQLYDLELLERAVQFLAGHPEAEAKMEKEVQPKERDFLYSLREELSKL